MDEILIATQYLYMFAVVVGITLGGLTGFTILLFRHKRSRAYDLDT